MLERARAGCRWQKRSVAMEAALLAVGLMGLAGVAGLTVAFTIRLTQVPSLDEYLTERDAFLTEELNRFLGADLVLSSAEQAVNARLMEFKTLEYNVTEDRFPPAKHFFATKVDIESSNVFQFIRKMPKGALLHGHDLAMVSVDYLVKNVTYRPNLWTRRNGSHVSLRFSNSSPSADWVLVSSWRADSNATAVDQTLRQAFELNVEDPDTVYPDQDSVWAAFDQRFSLLFSALIYKPVFEDYFRQTLKEFYDDNVMYIEMRGVLPTVYDLDGQEYGPVEVATMYRDIALEFQLENPTFIGMRFIYAPSRHVTLQQMTDYIETYRNLKNALPYFVVGFDLVAHEDEGRPLVDFAQALLDLKTELPDTKFFFHAGETNWETSSTDENLVDAVLLNASRIGHGYAIVKHPKVMEEVKKRGIGIEINPISNQVLGLVKDLRNHPGASLLADNYPVVISCDDPGMWGAKGLSYDFYEAFMGMAGLRADLRFLKQLALNSITYSALSRAERLEATTTFDVKWKNFITDMTPFKRTGGARRSWSENNSIDSR